MFSAASRDEKQVPSVTDKIDNAPERFAAKQFWQSLQRIGFQNEIEALKPLIGWVQEVGGNIFDFGARKSSFARFYCRGRDVECSCFEALRRKLFGIIAQPAANIYCTLACACDWMLRPERKQVGVWR